MCLWVFIFLIPLPFPPSPTDSWFVFNHERSAEALVPHSRPVSWCGPHCPGIAGVLVHEPHGAGRDPAEMQGCVPGAASRHWCWSWTSLNFNFAWFSWNILELATLGSSQKQLCHTGGFSVPFGNYNISPLCTLVCISEKQTPVFT